MYTEKYPFRLQQAPTNPGNPPPDTTEVVEHMMDMINHTYKVFVKEKEIDDMTKLYSPLFSIRLDCDMNESPNTPVTYITRILCREYATCRVDQTAFAVFCAKITSKIVNDFATSMGTQKWQFDVIVPEQTKVKQERTVMECHPVAAEDMNPDEMEAFRKYGTASRAIPIQRTWLAPAVKEELMPNTKTMFCNTGWVTDDSSEFGHRLVVALPHYSFKWSGGTFMIGSCRASIDEHAMKVTISAPTLMSMEGALFGSHDIGRKGILNFFHWNPSNEFVPDFEKPESTMGDFERKPRNIAICPRKEKVSM